MAFGLPLMNTLANNSLIIKDAEALGPSRQNAADLANPAIGPKVGQSLFLQYNPTGVDPVAANIHWLQFVTASFNWAGGAAGVLTIDNLGAANPWYDTLAVADGTGFTDLPGGLVQAGPQTWHADLFPVAFSNNAWRVWEGVRWGWQTDRAPLRVRALAPNAGPADGGYAVNITGDGFADATNVSFGNVPATSFTVNSDTWITAFVPSQPVGNVDVTVTTPYGVSDVSLADQFTYGKTMPTITWDTPADITYSTPLDTTQLDASSGGLDGMLTYSQTVGTLLNAGAAQTLSVTFAPADTTDYTSVTQTVLINVNQAALTYTINNDSQTYGTAANLASDLPATIDTGVNGENLAISYYSDGATSTANVGTYGIYAWVTDGTGLFSNYSVTLVQGTLAVNPATLAVAADDKTMTYGGSVPTLTATVTGFVNGDDGSVVSGAASLTTDATGSSAAGTYAITANVGTLAASNYAFSFTTGTLTVNPATPAVTSLGQTTGPTSGGYTIDITGSGFTGATAVSFGGVAATSVTVNSDTSITAGVPAQAQGTVADVTVTTPRGTSATSPADQFTYVETTTVTGFSFSVWLYADDSLSSIDYQFTSAAFGTTVYASGTATSVTLSGGTSSSFSAAFGLTMYTATVTGLNISVPVGASWFTLQNAVTSSGNLAYWGESDGSSQAVENYVGSVGSESFAISGASGNLYDNGSDPGTNAWGIASGYAVTNSFYVSA